MSGRPFDAVIFDYAGVVGRPSWDLTASSPDGNEVPHEEIEDLICSQYGDPQHPLCRWELGELSFRTFREQMSIWSSDRDVDWSSLEMTVGEIVEIDPIVDLVDELRSMGYRVALVSNTMHEFKPIMDGHRLFDGFFDVYLRSCDLGVRKPDRAIFEEALRRLGTSPRRTVFVDDNIVCVEGGLSVGLHALHVVDHEVTADELRTLLLGSAQRSSSS